MFSNGAGHQKHRARAGLRRIICFWHRRKRLILGPAILFAAMTILYCLLAVPVYRSVVRIQVDPEEVEGQSSLSSTVDGYRSYLITQSELIREPVVSERVFTRLGTNDLSALHLTDLTALRGALNRAAGQVGFRVQSASSAAEIDQEGGVRAISDRIDVKIVEDSRLIELGFGCSDAGTAVTVANMIAEEYLRRSIETKTEAAEMKEAVLTGRLSQLRARLGESERLLAEYASSHSLFSGGMVQSNEAQDKIARLNLRLSEVQSAHFRAQAQLRSLESTTMEAFPESLRTTGIKQLEEKRHELELALAELMSVFDENWPDVRKKKRELESLDVQVVQAKEASLAEAVRQAQLDYDSTREELRLLEGALTRQKNTADQLNTALLEYASLQRDVESNQTLFNAVIEQMKTAGVSSGLKVGNIRLVSRAQRASRPDHPRPVLYTLAALLMGLLIGVVTACLLEFWDETVHSAGDVEEFGVPALSLIPEFPVQRVALESGSNRSVTTLDIVRTEDSLPAVELASQNRSNWNTWEAFRNLRTAIFLSSPDHPPHSILVTSSIPREGKTTTASHLGVILAQTGEDTVIVEVDLRKPTLKGRFHLNGNKGGMRDFLSGKADLLSCVHRTGIPHLYVIPAGGCPPNPSELIASRRMKLALDHLKEAFKFVVVDTPPVLTVSDSQLLCKWVDAVVLVVRSGMTPRDLVAQARAKLLRAGANLVGAAINGADLKNPEYLYYSRYSDDESYYSGFKPL